MRLKLSLQFRGKSINFFDVHAMRLDGETDIKIVITAESNHVLSADELSEIEKFVIQELKN